MHILLVTDSTRKKKGILFRLVYIYYTKVRRATVTVFDDSIDAEFKSDVWRTIDTQSREFAEGWYKQNGKDQTVCKDISYGNLVRLPIFLQIREELWRAYSLAQHSESSRPDLIVFVGSGLYENCRKINNGKTKHLGIRKSFFSLAAVCFWVMLTSVKQSSTRYFRRQNKAKNRSGEYAFVFSKSNPQSSFMKPLLPLISKLQEAGKEISIFTFGNKDFQDLTKMFPHSTVYDLKKEGASSGKNLFGVIKKVIAAAYHQPKGLHAMPVFSEQIMFNPWLPWALLVKMAPDFSVSQHALHRILQKRTTILSATENHPFEKLVFSSAAQHGAKTVLVQHGVTNETIKNQMVNTPSLASQLFVWGIYSKEYYSAHGVGEGRVCVTGSALFDSVEPDQYKKDDVLKKYSLPNKKRFILFSGQHFTKSKNEAVARMALEAFQKLKKEEGNDDVGLIITPHPAKKSHTDEAFFTRLAEQHNLVLENDVFIRRTSSAPHELIVISKMLITSSSTIHVDAAIFHCPVILVNIDGVAPMDMAKVGAAPSPTSVPELVEAMRDLLKETQREKYLAQYHTFLQNYIYFPHSATDTMVKQLLETP